MEMSLEIDRPYCAQVMRFTGNTYGSGGRADSAHSYARMRWMSEPFVDCRYLDCESPGIQIF